MTSSLGENIFMYFGANVFEKKIESEKEPIFNRWPLLTVKVIQFNF